MLNVVLVQFDKINTLIVIIKITESWLILAHLLIVFI